MVHSSALPLKGDRTGCGFPPIIGQGTDRVLEIKDNGKDRACCESRLPSSRDSSEIPTLPGCKGWVSCNSQTVRGQEPVHSLVCVLSDPGQ